MISYTDSGIFKQTDAWEVVGTGDTHAFIEYFCGKSFMITKNQKILDYLMNREIPDIIIHRLDFPDWVRHPDKYKILLSKFADRLIRCKEYCRISGNDKWGKTLNDWELLVTYLHKYEEYVRENGYIRFNDFLKNNNVIILWDPV